MKLKDKTLTGLLKSYSSVNFTLTQQGFKRTGTLERATYELIIKDSATRSAYFLRIPTTLEQNSSPNHPIIRIGKPSLRSQLFMNRMNPSLSIPDSIRLAAESKLAEIADYLQSQK